MAASVLPVAWQQALDDEGVPIDGALLYSFAAGTDTEQALYSDVDLTIPLDNPVEADSGGFFPVMYMLATGYKLTLNDADDVLVRTADNIGDIGYIFAQNFGTEMAAGSRNVTSGYVLLSTDRLVTVASSGATVFNLTAASSRTQEITIKNMSTGTVVVTPNGADVLEGALTTYTIEAASSPLFPAITLLPVTGGWLIKSSHRAA
jgi:hypothetical protein